MLSRALGHAFTGMWVGAAFGYGVIWLLFGSPFTRYDDLRGYAAALGLALQPWPVSWLYVVLGALVGAAIQVPRGLARDARTAQREDGFREEALQIGEGFSVVPAPGVEEKFRPFFREHLDVRNAISAQVRGMRIAAADVFHTVRAVDDDKTTVQTVAFYAPAGLRFPSFTLQPEGLLLNVTSSVLGVADIDFPSHPAFSKAYHLTGEDAEDVRALFGDRLLEALGSREGFYIQGRDEGIAIYVPEQLYAPAELVGFLSKAAEIFGLFEESARAAAFTPERAPKPVGDVKEMVEKMPGLIGMEARRNLFLRADVEAFLRQPVPRRIPSKVRRYGDRFGLDAAKLFGTIFTATGLMLMYMFGTQAYWGKGLFSGDTLGVLLGLFLFSIAAPVLCFGVRANWRNRRLLRRGKLTEGRIESVAPTGGSMNGNRIYLLTVRYRLEGRDVTGSCKIMEPGIDRALKLKKEGKPARILYDPGAPERILFPEALISISMDYDP